MIQVLNMQLLTSKEFMIAQYFMLVCFSIENECLEEEKMTDTAAEFANNEQVWSV